MNTNDFVSSSMKGAACDAQGKKKGKETVGTRVKFTLLNEDERDLAVAFRNLQNDESRCAAKLKRYSCPTNLNLEQSGLGVLR